MSIFPVIKLSNPLKNAQFSAFLDYARAVAAIMVCLAHTRNLLFPDFSKNLNLGPISKAFYFFTLFGTQAVVVFFVISGLLIGGLLLSRMYESRAFRYGEYMIARIVRLGVVLYPALALSFILQILSLTKSCQHTDSLYTFVSNILFLQNISAAPVCNDHPLWSLSNEMFYYITAPIVIWSLISAVRRTGRDRIVALVLLIISAAVVALDMATTTFQEGSIGFGYLIWLVGLLPFLVRLDMRWWWGFGAFCMVLIASRIGVLGGEYTTGFALAITFCLTLMMRFPTTQPGRLYAAIGKGFASFSYSLYLVHMPLAELAKKLLGAQLNPSRPLSYLIYAAVVLVIMAVAWGFGAALESQTVRARQWLLSLFSARVERRDVV